MLIVVILLGIGAAASLFSTLNDARMNTRAQLNVFAKMLAQSAVEEMLVKITNNAADFGTQPDFDGDGTTDGPEPGIRYTFDPVATRFFAYSQAEGMPRFNIAPVEVLGRSIVKPENAAKKQEFEELVTAGPNFAKNSIRAAIFGGEDKDWHRFDSSGVWQTSPTGYMPTDYKDEWTKMFDSASPWQDTFKSMVQPTHGAGRTYLDTRWRDDYRTNTPANPAVRTAFDALEPLSEKWDWVDDRTKVNDECHFSDCTISGDRDYVYGYANTGMKSFMDDWDDAMDAVADQVADRIAGCGGDPTYGIGAMMASIVLGNAAVDNSDAEEDFRNTALEGGITDYQAYLVSVHGRAYSTDDMPVKVSKQVTAHRIVAKMKLGTAMDMLRTTAMPYVMIHYNLTPQDFQILGWATMAWADGGDEPSGDTDRLGITVKSEFFTKLNDRYPDNPNPRVVPFQAASCTGPIQ